MDPQVLEVVRLVHLDRGFLQLGVLLEELGGLLTANHLGGHLGIVEHGLGAVVLEVRAHAALLRLGFLAGLR